MFRRWSQTQVSSWEQLGAREILRKDRQPTDMRTDGLSAHFRCFRESSPEPLDVWPTPAYDLELIAYGHAMVAGNESWMRVEIPSVYLTIRHVIG